MRWARYKSEALRSHAANNTLENGYQTTSQSLEAYSFHNGTVMPSDLNGTDMPSVEPTATTFYCASNFLSQLIGR